MTLVHCFLFRNMSIFAKLGGLCVHLGNQQQDGVDISTF